AAAYLGVQGVRMGMSISDDYINTLARLDLVNDKMQTTAELQTKIFQAADNARGSYSAMAAAAGKMGILAKDAFGNNNELIHFTELMQKSFRVGGASTMEQQAGMYQLTQAMAAGKLQGDEFRSIMENAPMLAQAIANFTGKSQGDLKQMSADGVITADIIKGAMFSAADEINEKFETIPMTFGDVFNSLSNKALRVFGPVITKVNDFLNSAGGASFITSMENGIAFAALAVDGLISGVIWLTNVIQNGWGIIEPMLAIIGASLTAWAVTKIPLLVTNLWKMIAPIAGAAKAWLVAHWPNLLIGAAIGFVLYAMIKWGDATVWLIGFIGGLFGAFFGFLYNLFANFANKALSVAEFFANVWRDPIYAVQKLFYDLSINSLQFMANIAKGIENLINKIPGLHIDITSSMDGLLNKLESARDNLKSEADVVNLMRFEQKDYGEAFDIGRNIGKNIGSAAVDGVQGAFNSLTNMFKTPEGLGAADYGDMFPNIDKVGEVGKIKDTVDISSEDIKIMRELAEMKNIQNFVTLTPSASYVHNGDVRNGEGSDTIIAKLKTLLEQEIASSASGVFQT
ncbi:MAG: tape measure protein, partial [Desulfitobacterium hafniense]